MTHFAQQHFTAGAPDMSGTGLVRALWRHRSLIAQLTRREVVGRYRGSAMGLLWSLINPVLMLAVYTFVFSVVFKARWGGGGGGRAEFAILLFAGLIVFNVFAECINKSPNLIVNHTNFVKKVVFPLEILPVVVLLSALFHAAASVLVLVVFMLITNGALPLSVLLLPVAIAPMLLLTLGLAWILASLGVFLRDVGQTVGIFTTVLMFMSPIFFPIEAIPEQFRSVLALNPLAFVIEQARNVVVWGRPIAWGEWVLHILVDGAVAWLGYTWFQKTRRGFADVL